MGKIVDIEQYKQSGGMSESQHKDLEMYRKLGVSEVFCIQGKDEEDCELKFLNALVDKDTDVVYVDDPNVTRNAKQ